MKRFLFTLAAGLLFTLGARAQTYLYSAHAALTSGGATSEAETDTYIAFDEESVYVVLESGREFEWTIQSSRTCPSGHLHLDLGDGEELIVEEERVTYRKGSDKLVLTRLLNLADELE